MELDTPALQSGHGGYHHPSHRCGYPGQPKLRIGTQGKYLEISGDYNKAKATLCCKAGLGALVLAALLIIRSGIFLAVGIVQGFQGDIPWGRFGLFTLISWAVSMMVYALQQGLSLRFLNQAAALVCGIAGSFLGILSMLFPPALTRCVPWGYYGLLTLVGMDWNPATRVTAFHWQWPEPADLILLLLWAAVFLIVGRTLFVRKEV